MEYTAALELLKHEATDMDGLLVSLRMGKVPTTTQTNRILEALRSVFDAMGSAAHMERELASSLYALGFYSIEYARLLPGGDCDCDRKDFTELWYLEVQAAVESIFEGQWVETKD
jgi:hypothetical protein